MRRPFLGAEPLPTTTHFVRRRMQALAAAIKGPVNIAPGHRDARLSGCLLMPQADLLIAGTACHRPLLFAEAERIAQYSRHDLILLRYDAERGVTFDLYMQSVGGWLDCFRPSLRGDDLWFVADADHMPLVRAGMCGLELYPGTRGEDVARERDFDVGFPVSSGRA
jgi:hypothetical protein